MPIGAVVEDELPQHVISRKGTLFAMPAVLCTHVHVTLSQLKCGGVRSVCAECDEVGTTLLLLLHPRRCVRETLLSTSLFKPLPRYEVRSVHID